MHRGLSSLTRIGQYHVRTQDTSFFFARIQGFEDFGPSLRNAHQGFGGFKTKQNKKRYILFAFFQCLWPVYGRTDQDRPTISALRGFLEPETVGFVQQERMVVSFLKSKSLQDTVLYTMHSACLCRYGSRDAAQSSDAHEYMNFFEAQLPN